MDFYRCLKWVKSGKLKRSKYCPVYHGGTVLALSPADFGKLIADDTEKWGKVIKFAGIKPQ